MTATADAWPAGATWVFQGTVAEDNTAGTHVCTLTVTPGAGNEMEVIGALITVGNTATAQLAQMSVTDGTNALLVPLNPSGGTGTTASLNYPWPTAATTTATASTSNMVAGRLFVSGTMVLKLQVNTTAVSVTQTFAVVCRIKGAKPTATLADTVGTPTLTTNTNQVF